MFAMDGPIPAKVVFAGDTNVGKTSLINSFFRGSLAPRPSVCADIRMLPVTCDGERVSLALWDTAGQEQYQALTPAYFRDADLGVFVFDISGRLSFDDIPGWHQMVSNTVRLPTVILVGNKADLPERAVKLQEGQELAASLNAIYIETSAITTLGIDTLKMELARASLQMKKPKEMTDVSIETQSGNVCSC
jgi:small GTP-binding protein